MIDYLPFLMLPVAFVLMFLGVQVAFSMMLTAVLFGLAIFGDKVVHQFIEKIEDISSNFVFAAVPLFVFMGAMLEKSGIADKLFEAIHIWTRRLPGGLALATVLMCIFFAASSGVIGATESVVGLLTIPIMLRYGYSKPLISGTICAGGSLGTIIPPSVVAVVMGPLANQSVGDLMYGMVFPGLIMGGLYLVYILVLCTVKPSMGPRIPPEPGDPTLAQKLWITTRNMVPPVIMIFAVLGSILLGWASPTEAAAIGAASRSSIFMYVLPPVVMLQTTLLPALIRLRICIQVGMSPVGMPSLSRRACRWTIAAPASAAPMAWSAMSFGVTGRYGDIVGVWVAPVTAQVMMILLGVLAMG